jgi:short-subunit dehydrogenase
MNRTGKGIALITGATSGIGAEFARRLAREGYDLILHGRREEILAARCVELERTCRIRAERVLAELSDPDALRMLEERVKNTPDLEILVNNAGSSTRRRFSEEEIDGQERLIRVHVVAAVRLTHAALPGMLRRNGGSIINVSSVAAFMISPRNATYCATKLYLNSFSESLALELRGSGVRVQVLCPGFTVSDFHARIGYDTSGDFFKGFMTPEEVVETSLRDLRKGKVVSIPGWKYRFAAFAPRLIPRPLFYRIVLAYSRRNKAVREQTQR